MTAEATGYITLPDRQVWTLDDLLELPDDGHRYEILDGSLVMSAAATPAHQIASNRLVQALNAVAPEDAYAVTEIGVELGFGGHAPVPDVVVGPRSRMFSIETKGLLASEVMLLVEVISPGSVARDRLLKRGLYAEAGIPAYWLVDLRGRGAPSVVLYSLRAGEYREVRRVVAGEDVEVAEPFPFRLRPADLVGYPAGR